MKTVKLDAIKPNPNNPRVMRDAKFWCLVESIKEDPQFLSKRGIVHADGVILGGNQRYRAIIEALKDAEFRERIGLKSASEIPAAWLIDASELSQEERKRFVIKDNAPPGMSGDWDDDGLANEFDDLPLDDWGLAPLGYADADADAGNADGTEYGENAGDGIVSCKCPTCGHKHDA